MLKIRHCFSDPICFTTSKSDNYSRIYNKGRVELHSVKVDVMTTGSLFNRIGKNIQLCFLARRQRPFLLGSFINVQKSISQ